MRLKFNYACKRMLEISSLRILLMFLKPFEKVHADERFVRGPYDEVTTAVGIDS